MNYLVADVLNTFNIVSACHTTFIVNNLRSKLVLKCALTTLNRL